MILPDIEEVKNNIQMMYDGKKAPRNISIRSYTEHNMLSYFQYYNYNTSKSFRINYNNYGLIFHSDDEDLEMKYDNIIDINSLSKDEQFNNLVGMSNEQIYISQLHTFMKKLFRIIG